MSSERLVRGFALFAILSSQLAAQDASAQLWKPTPTPKEVSVAGQVLGAADKPVAGARVVLREWANIRLSENDSLREIADVLAETKSDAEGRFRFEKVPAPPFRSSSYTAPWDVVAFADGFGFGWAHLAQTADEQPQVSIKLPSQKTILGRLVDAAGAPVVGCMVEVAELTIPLSSSSSSKQTNPNQISLWRSQLSPTAKSNDDGRFEIRSLPAGKRLLVILTHPRYVRETIYVATSDEPQAAVRENEYIDNKRQPVDRPVLMSGFSHTLKPGWLVRGRVLFADTRAAVANAKVHLVWGSRGTSQTADGEGRFEFSGLDGQKFNLSTGGEQPGYLAARKLLAFPDDRREQDVTLELQRGISVRGTVVDADTGTGVAQVDIRYLPPNSESDDGNPWSPARGSKSDEAGQFELIVPPGPGTISVYASDLHPTHDVPTYLRWREQRLIALEHSAPIDVKPGQPLEGVRLAVGRGLVLRGRAMDAAGEPVAGAEVMIRGSNDSFRARPAVKTNQDGRFELVGIDVAGKFNLQFHQADRKLRATMHVDVEPWQGLTHVVDVDPIKLQGSVAVSGQVLVDGKPRRDVTVIAYTTTRINDRGLSSSEPFRIVTTDVEGKFSLEAPPETDFYVSPSPQGITSTGSRNYHLPSGESLELPVFNEQSLASFVEGIVIDPDGKPVAGVTVTARAVGRNDGGASDRTTGADGRFRIENLSNGPLQVMAYLRRGADPARRNSTIMFPAKVDADTGQTDVRIVFDPKLKRTLPTAPRRERTDN